MFAADGHTSRIIVMEYVMRGSLGAFVLRTGKHLPQNERKQLYGQFAMDVVEVSLWTVCHDCGEVSLWTVCHGCGRG